jgi:nitrous oxidase accessory protein
MRVRSAELLVVVAVLMLGGGNSASGVRWSPGSDAWSPGPSGPGAVVPGPSGPWLQSQACPDGRHVIPAGAALQPRLDAAADGDVLCLAPGSYSGPIVIRTRVVLHGTPDAVIRSTGEGTTVRVLAAGAELRGFTVEGSGRRHDIMDAAVLVRGERAAVRGLTVRGALFGLVAEQAYGVVFEDNLVIGDPAVPEGLRGDGIRLWEVRGASIVNNRVQDSRDVVIWYSPGNLISGNTVVGSRYAIHFMYSGDCVVSGNRFTDNVVGVFVMYSRNIAIRDNVIEDNTKVDSMGLGIKDSGDIIVERNRLVRVRECLYLDNSPFREGDVMIVRSNTFALCQAGVTFHKSETRTTFEDNRFEANGTPAVVEGRGTAQSVVWRRNYFDDYAGYDLDGDGFGDVPYELRDLSERLVARRADLAFFRGTAALALVDMAARLFPILQPQTVFVDPRPRMQRGLP